MLSEIVIEEFKELYEKRYGVKLSALLPLTLVSNPEEENLSAPACRRGRFEPPKNRSRKQKSAAFSDANPIWLPLLNKLRTFSWTEFQKVFEEFGLNLA
jgi:hypothetical protein